MRGNIHAKALSMTISTTIDSKFRIQDSKFGKLNHKERLEIGNIK
jgi:hypothetical protein